MGKADKSLNPLLRTWETPHNIAPFSIINDEHFEPALEIASAETLIEIEQILQIIMLQRLKIQLKLYLKPANY